MTRLLQLSWKILALFFVISSIANAFNNSSMKGNYAFILSGTSSIVKVNQATTVGTGLLIADGNGHVTGHGSFRSAGITCIGTLKGTYSISNDGTGFIATNFTTNTPGCFTSVVDVSAALFDNGKGFYIASNENDYLSGSLQRQK